jgi:uncharacterized protein (DUF58 family)
MTDFLPKGHQVLAERLIEGRHVARMININAQSKALALLAGRRRIRQRGRGVDFEEVRLYAPGDDIRTIDWRVTARSGDPHTKLFQEDREQPIVLMVDLRSPMWFGSKNCFKSVLASHVASVLAWAGLEAGERVGGIAMTDAGIFEIKPQRSKRSVLRLLRLLESAPSPDAAANHQHPAISWSTALNQLKNLSRPGARLMLISDFSDFLSEPNVEKTLRDIVGHRQVVCFKVTDPLDATLPPAGRYAISDGSRQIKMDTSQQAIRQRYQVDFERSQQDVIDYLRRYQVPLVTVDTDENPNELLQQVFPKR